MLHSTREESRQRGIFIAIATLAICAMLTLVALPARAFADGYQQDWMKSISDDAKISQLTIPGTHDSACYNTCAVTKEWAECQSWDIYDQLRNGIRALDLRYGYDDGDFGLYHGNVWPFIYTCYELYRDEWDDLAPKVLTLDGELYKLSQFLKDHPNEFIIINVQRENDDSGDAVNEALNKLYEKYNVYTRRNNSTTVGEVRGRIVLGNDFMQGVDEHGPYNRYQGSVEEKVSDLHQVFDEAPTTYLGDSEPITQKVIYTNLSWRAGVFSLNRGPIYYARMIQKEFFYGNRFDYGSARVPLGGSGSYVDIGKAFGVVLYDYPTNQIIDWTIGANKWAFSTSASS